MANSHLNGKRIERTQSMKIVCASQATQEKGTSMQHAQIYESQHQQWHRRCPSINAQLFHIWSLIQTNIVSPLYNRIWRCLSKTKNTSPASQCINKTIVNTLFWTLKKKKKICRFVCDVGSANKRLIHFKTIKWTESPKRSTNTEKKKLRRIRQWMRWKAKAKEREKARRW